jgi:transcription elongation GreA/GreB family factor
MALDKKLLLDQLRQRYVQSRAVARRAETDAREAARTMATESEKKEDGRVAIEFGGLASGQAQRQAQAQRELEALDALAQAGLPHFGEDAAVALGALVEVGIDGDEEDEHEERTLFVLPAGAGTELTGPGGDGFLSVVTPSSPVGRALMGKHAGESFDLATNGALREWTILEVY